MKKLVIVMLLAISHFTATAQTAREEFDKILAVYQQPLLSFEGRITMRAKGSNAIMDVVPVRYRTNNDQYYCKIGKVEIFVGARYVVQLDHEGKKMIVGRRTGSKQKMPVMDLNAIKEMLPVEDEVMKLEKGAENNHLVIQMPYGSGIHHYDLNYDPNTWYIRKVTMEMDAGDGSGDVLLMEMEYRNYSTVESTPLKSESDYFNISGNVIRVNKNYDGYQLITEL